MQILAWMLVIFASSVWTHAVAQVNDEPSVTLAVQPDRIPPGGSVAITGLGYAEPGKQIVITVTSPDGKVTKLQAVPDAQSKFSASFIGANAPGTYRVSAEAGGAKGTPATGQFTVQNATVDIDDDVADNKKFLEEGLDLIQAVRKEVDTMPESPAKTEMSAKLTKLEPQWASLTQQSSHLATMLQPFMDLLHQHPETQPALQPMFDHLAELDQKTREASQTFLQISAQSKKTLQSCDTIDQSTQALKALSDVLDIDHDPFEFVTGYASNLAGSVAPGSGAAAKQAANTANLAYGMRNAGGSKEGVDEAKGAAKGSLVENGIELGGEAALSGKLVGETPQSVRSSDGYKFTVLEMKKLAPKVVGDGADVIQQFLNVAALVTDVATYANNNFFARYCQKFVGTFSATMKAKFYAAGHEQNDWWNYGTSIKGKITLRYPKDATGTVPLSGQFEGGATNFTYDESVWTNSDVHKLAPGSSLVGKKDTAPVPADSGQGGVLASLASPTSFYIPVSGSYANGKVSFHLEDARTDFVDSYVKGHTFYVVLSQYTLGLPVMGHFSLPYQNAHFILNHFNFDYAAKQTKDSIVFEADDVQDRPRLPANESHYVLKLKACNPDCGGTKD